MAGKVEQIAWLDDEAAYQQKLVLLAPFLPQGRGKVQREQREKASCPAVNGGMHLCLVGVVPGNSYPLSPASGRLNAAREILCS
jgi:hypothetical protein